MTAGVETATLAVAGGLGTRAVTAPYCQVIASLPALPHPFSAKHRPLSRYQLDQRLALLDADGAAVQRRIEQTLAWPAAAARDDEAVAAQARATLATLDDPALHALVAEALTRRALVAALRRRRAGEGPPPWAVGPWAAVMARRWREPAFRLERLYPWLTEARRCLDDGDALGLERLEISVAWSAYGRAAEAQLFDLTAVVAYVLRWHLIDRWLARDGAGAATRLDQLVAAGLGPDRLFASAP